MRTLRVGRGGNDIGLVEEQEATEAGREWERTREERVERMKEMQC